LELSFYVVTEDHSLFVMVSYHKLDVLDRNNNIPSEARPSFRSSSSFDGKKEMVWRKGVGEGVG